MLSQLWPKGKNVHHGARQPRHEEDEEGAEAPTDMAGQEEG